MRWSSSARFEEIAAVANTWKRRVQQLISLAFLTPEIVRQFTQGTQSTSLTSDWLIRHNLPAD